MHIMDNGKEKYKNFFDALEIARKCKTEDEKIEKLRDTILSVLSAYGEITVDELVKICGVSKMVILIQLDELKQNGKILINNGVVKLNYQDNINDFIETTFEEMIENIKRLSIFQINISNASSELISFFKMLEDLKIIALLENGTITFTSIYKDKIEKMEKTTKRKILIEYIKVKDELNKFISDFQNNFWKNIYNLITKVDKSVYSNEIIIRLHLNKKTLVISHNELLSEKKFRNIILLHFGIYPPKPKNYQDFLNFVLSKAVTVYDESEASIEKEIIDTLKDYIKNSIITVNLEDALSYGFVYVENNQCFIPNRIIETLFDEIMKENDIGLRKLSTILQDFIIKKIRKRIHGIRVYFWVFDLERLGVHPKSKSEGDQFADKEYS